MASGEGGPSGNGNDDRRHPQNMQGLLSLCAGLADQPVSGQVEMDAERRAFLVAALNESTVNPVDFIKQCVNKILKPTESEDDEDEQIQALESLVEWCEQIDLAMDFHKIGGFVIFPVILKHEEPELRWLGCELIATITQNNPYCQDVIVKEHKLPELLNILDTDSNATVKTKSLFAISCLIRECEEAQKIFLENDGFSVVMRAMQADVEKLKIKAAFMLSSICTDKPAFKDVLCDIGMVEQLMGNLGEEHEPYHEHLMSALLTIVRDHPRSIAECSRPELNFVAMLNERKRDLQGKEEFQEELEYTDTLLNILNTQTGSHSNTEDQEANR